MQDYFEDLTYNSPMTNSNQFMGHDLYIERKKIKNMYLRLNKDGSLKVTCPYWTTEKEVFRFLEDKQNWVEKTEKKIETAKKESLTGEDGTSAVWLGEKYNVQFNMSYRDQMVIDQSMRIITYFVKDKDPLRIRRLFYTAGNQQLAKMIAERRGRLDQLVCVNHGKEIPHITIRYTTSQWGSCTPAHHAVSLSSRLIHYPAGCLDYVMTHEYAHILVPNHSKAFYEVVSTYMPDWKKYSDILKQRH